MDQIISHFPSVAAMARALGVDTSTVQYWQKLGYAPRWQSVHIAAAVVARGGDITAEQVAALRPKK